MDTSPTLPNPPSFSKYVRSSNHDQLEPEPETELSIFDAKKYFNYEESNPTNEPPPPPIRHHHLINLQPPRFSSASSVDSYGGRNHRLSSFNATPTASSEASWNSKTGLLSNPPGAIHVSIKNCDDHHEKKKSGYKCKWLFGSSKCWCSGKKSVQVEDNYKLQHLQQPNKTPPHNFCNNNKPNWIPSTTINNRICATTTSSSGTCGTTFTFPVLNSRFCNEILDPPRESLEVFHPSSGSRKSSLDHVQSHRALFPRQSGAYPFPLSPSKSRMTITDVDDVASDASSDLFEIESFSTQTTTYPIRDSLDEAPRLYCHHNMSEEMVVSPCVVDGYYEPSEASIEWSVTTAEGFDRASVTNMSSVTAQDIDDEIGVEKMMMRKKRGGGGGGLLMSCRCEKSVSVVVGSEESSGTKHVNCRASKPPLATSRSSRLSVT